jgi:MFS family permease
VPVVLTRVAGPDLSQTKPLSLLRLYAISPLGVAASLGAGLISGAFYGMGAVFGAAEGMSVFAISIFMGVSLIGGLLMQWPIGWLSDRFDRRTVLLWVLIVIATLCLIEFTLSHVPHPTRWLLVFTGLFGGGAATVYPLAVAHAFDYVDRDQMVPASTGMLLAWALGATAGPILASQCMSLGGDWALFLYLSAVAGLLAVFVRFRMSRRMALPAEAQAKFAPRGEGTVAGTLDPRPT